MLKKLVFSLIAVNLLLIAAYFIVTHRSPEERLFMAVLKKDLPTVEKLVAHGVNLDTPYSKGMTVLIFSVVVHLDDIARYLIEHGADVNRGDQDGFTPLMAALATGNLPITEALLVKGARVDAVDRSRKTPVTYAATGGDIEAVKLLAQYGASLDSPLPDSLTSLIVAVSAQRLALAEYLADRPALRLATDGKGNTALHWAVAVRDPEMVRMLLRKGFPATITNEVGKTPRDFARQNGYQEILAILGGK
jgi:uncharacterized protein